MPRNVSPRSSVEASTKADEEGTCLASVEGDELSVEAAAWLARRSYGTFPGLRDEP